jgi:DNA-binding CsgD family transcriptional regulator
MAQNKQRGQLHQDGEELHPILDGGRDGQSLIGRDNEVRQIENFVTKATTCGGSLVLSGDPGVGKTALIEVGIQAASEIGADVLRVVGTEFESNISYSGLHQLLSPLSDELRSLSSSHRNALAVVFGLNDEPPPQPLVLVSAVLALIAAAASKTPILVVVDDLHWLDRASASVLTLMSRRLAGTRIAFLAAFRAGWQTHFDESGLPQLSVRGLTDGAATRLVTAAFPALSPAVRRRIVREAVGNPLALLEFPLALSEPHLGEGYDLPRHLPLTRRLEGLFSSRVVQLHPLARQLMLLAALEGTGDLRTLEAIVGDSTLGQLSSAETIGLVRIDTSGGRISFRHPLIGSAVIQAATILERQEAHRLLALGLADDPVRQAWHLAEATIGTNDNVALLLEEASHQVLQRGDAVQAINMLLRAAAFSSAMSDRSRRFAQAAYIGAVRTEEFDLPHLLEEAQKSSQDEESALLVAAASGYLLISDSDVGVDAVHQMVLGALQTHYTEARQRDDSMTPALGVLALVSWNGMRPELWAPFHELIVNLASPPPELVLADHFWADPARTAATALPLLDAAISEVGVRTDTINILYLAGSATYVDRLPRLREPLARAQRVARDSNAPRELIVVLNCILPDAWTSGHWDLLREWADEVLSLAKTHGPKACEWCGQYFLALLDGAAGHETLAMQRTDEIFRWSIPRQMGLAEASGHHAAGFAALSNRDFEEAYHHLVRVACAGELRSPAPPALWVTLDLVESAVQTGRIEEARCFLAACEEAGLAQISSRQHLLTTAASALVLSGAEANSRFLDALAAPGSAQWPFDLARCQLLYGEHLRRMRIPSDARTMLRAALGTFEALGADAWASRARSELRATGMSRSSRAQDPTREELSPQEYEVAALAASGLTNKEIAQRLQMSARTVGTHLYRVFPKLGVTSRAALRDALDATCGSTEATT